MIDPNRSFWWKLRRAQKHLDELKALIDGYSERSPYIAVRDTETNPDDTESIYIRAKLAKQPGPDVAVVLGDFAFNVRSALDHVAVALAPPSRKRKTAFPIYRENIWERDDAGEYVPRFEKDRESFLSRIKGWPEQAVTMIYDCQPYALPEPRHNVLTLLSALNNADKHVQLSTITTGLRDYEIIFQPDASGRKFRANLEGQGIPVVEDGAIATRLKRSLSPIPIVDSEMQVEIIGSARVAVQLPGYEGHFEIVPLCEQVLTTVSDGVVGPFETIIPHQTAPDAPLLQ